MKQATPNAKRQKRPHGPSGGWSILGCFLLLLATAQPLLAESPPPPADPVTAALQADPALRELLCAPDPAIPLTAGQLVAPILLYHHVGNAGLEGSQSTRFDVTAAGFETQLALLQQLGYQSLTVSQLAAALRGESSLPPRPIALTFDDAWANQYTTAFPLLQKYGMTATFYVPSRYPGARSTLSWDQLREMNQAGMEIGSHTRTHRWEPAAWGQVALSKSELEAQLGISVTTFSYPYGLVKYADLVQKAGYTSAVAVSGTAIQNPAQPWALRRIEISGRDTLATFIRRLPWRGQGTSLCPVPPDTSPPKE